MAITTIEGLKAAYPVLCERLEKEARGETTVSTVTIVKDSKERMGTWTEETRDLDNNLVSKRKDKYIYYPTDEIDTITMEKYNDKDVLVGKETLKHFRDGTQPDLTVVAVEIPKGL